MIEKEALFYYPIERFTGLNVPNSDQTALKVGESPYMKNFTVTDTYSIKKRDGCVLLHDFELNTRAVFADMGEKERLFIAVGTDIFTCPLPFDEQKLKKVGSVADSDNCFFISFGLKIYLWGGGTIQVYDEEKESFSEIEPYIPLVAVSCDTTGAGTPFEGVNMLTGNSLGFALGRVIKELRRLWYAFALFTKVPVVKSGAQLPGGMVIF